MASANPSDLNIENTNINTAPNVELSSQQKTLVGCVLDLFAGRPSLAKLQLWKDDGVFEDPIAKAHGRKEFEAQWYGLQTAFSEIERLHHEVKSAGNPIEMDLKTKYVVKGLGTEKIMESVVRIFTDGDKISKVEDRWNGSLPEGAVANVSCYRLSWLSGGVVLSPIRNLVRWSCVRHNIPLLESLLIGDPTGFPPAQCYQYAEGRGCSQGRRGG